LSVIGGQTKVVYIRRATIKIGSSTLAVGREITAQWGNEVATAAVIGSDVPINWTGQFKGQISIGYLYCTDLDLAALTEPGADGQVPETTITSELTDTQATAKKDTWTFKARLNDVQLLGRAGDFVYARASGVLTERPSRVQT